MVITSTAKIRLSFMVHIVCKKGLDLPFPKPEISENILNESDPKRLSPTRLSIDITPFASMRLKVCVDVGTKVNPGTPLVCDVSQERTLVSHVKGTVVEIERGLRRIPTRVIVEVAQSATKAKALPLGPIENITKEALIKELAANGFFSDIRQRPFDLPAHPKFLPKSIFIQAHTSAPGAASMEACIFGMENEMQAATQALNLISPGKVHLVHSKASSHPFFCNPEPANSHTVEGPHPSGCPSLHIEHIDPIKTPDEVVWTLNAKGLARLGAWLLHGQYSTDSIVHIFDANFEKGILVKAPPGAQIRELLELAAVPVPDNYTLIGGDPLMGTKLAIEDYLPWGINELYFLPKDDVREPLHFLRMKAKSFSNFKAYLKSKKPNFSTNKHGEERAFVDGSIYDRVMPLKIPTMPLLKAVMSEDFEKALELGLLEVASEDFALCSFICPSKIEMVEIIRSGLLKLADQSL
jgi:Na+-transporting NADH:ubiquinone oxidoreductase subunit A